MTILIGDCRDLMPAQGPFDLILADPPYGDTSLAWDRRVDGWLRLACAALKPSGSLWVFGSLRCFMSTAGQFTDAGLRYAQEIVWEKQNGTSFHADRFKRVYELVAQFYRADVPWSDVYNDVQTTPDTTARTVRRKMRPPHTGRIDAGHYVSEDGGPRLMRSLRCKDDRHHFRFIVSPEDATDMEDLKRFTRELMTQMEKDLGTKLEWVAVDHWNTDNPHVHVIMRGRANDGRDLVIDRDYIKSGMRDRAQDLITQELGPRTDLDVNRALSRQVEAERWTQIDRQLVRDANEQGVIDVAPSPDRQPDAYLTQKVGRLRHLEHLGLAETIGPGQWVIAKDAEPTLRELGQRYDIIKRMHHALDEQGIARGAADYVLAGETHGAPIVGRLVECGIDNELYGTAYAVVDGTDGRTHHIKLPNIEAAGDSAPGSIVELRSFEDAKGNRRIALATRSDLSIEAQTTAGGATWLDRQLVARDPVDLGSGFGLEVKQAMEARTKHLIQEGMARRDGERILFSRNLLGTLRRRELDALGDRLAAESGTPFQKSADGEYVAGTYRQRFALASGRFAMIDDGLGFKLVPWTPSIEKHIGKHISGVARADGGIDWSFGRKRGLGL